MNTSLFYLCTGFHRSGTSLVAQSLAQGGVKMGDELMGATFSNPLGHVEDMPVVRLHDRVFIINGTDWRYADDGPLFKPNWLSNYIQRYLQEKSLNEASYCGVKDPRAAFYLKDWQVSGKGQLRYVFVYRHWSACVNSILSRASRFLVNTPYPLKANKLNFGFFKQPEMVFNMWLATNRRLLEFYQSHGHNSLLFSHEAFVNDNTAVTQVASKIQLQPDMLSSSHFKPELITDSVPNALIDSVNPEIIMQCNVLWEQLQAASDVSVEVKIKTLSNHWVPTIKTSSLGHEVTSFRNFEFDSLTWDELLGFAVRINANYLTSKVLARIMRRSFGSADHYDSLSKIAHKFSFFLFTKLSKMRAMHLAANSWDPVNWHKYCEQQSNWQDLADDDLIQANPFSTRPVAEYSQDEAQFNILEMEIDDVISFIKTQTTDRAETLITNILLFSVFSNALPFKKLASLALEFDLTYLSEFSLIKSLRYDYNADTLMKLGDLYRKDGNGRKALQCFEHGVAMSPHSVPILARLGEVNLFLDNPTVAQHYTSRALEKSDKQPNPIALKCQKQLQNKTKNVAQNTTSSHANLALNYIADYAKIVEIGRIDPDYGDRVDKRNRAAAFILRDNTSWLTEGLQNIPKASHPLLQHYIYKQWKSIFPANVVQSNIGISEPNGVMNYPQFKLEQGTHRHAIIIDVVNLNVFRQLLNAIYASSIEADLFIISSLKLESDVKLTLEKYNLSNCKVQCFPASTPKVKRWLMSFKSELVDYSSVLYLHTDSEASVPRVKSEHLLAYWSWLGEADTLTKAISAFERNSALALIVPPYHTELLARDLGAHTINKYKELKDMAEYSSDTPYFLHPAGNMFCYKPQQLQRVVEMEGYEKYGKQFFFALPMLFDKHGLISKSLNEI